MRGARLIKTSTATWNRDNPGDHVLLLAFHLFDCYAGLRNRDAALGHAGLFVGRGRKRDPSHGISGVVLKETMGEWHGKTKGLWR